MDRIVLNGQEWIEWTEVTQYGPKFYFDVAQNEHGNNKLYTLTLYRYKLEPQKESKPFTIKKKIFTLVHIHDFTHISTIVARICIFVKNDV